MDWITVATAPNLLLTKQWRRNAAGEMEATDYDRAKHFFFRAEQVAGIGDLARILEATAADPHSAIIRGQPKPGIEEKLVRRLLKDRSDATATLTAVPRQWVLLDFDDLPLAANLDPLAGADDLVRHVVSYLPPAFSDVTCWWSFTSGMCLKPGIRMRLAYWLDRPMDGGELKQWLATVPVDRSVFGDAQLTYVAAPVFEDPRDDPFHGRKRSGILVGAAEVVAAPDEAALRRRDEPRMTTEGRVSLDRGGHWQSALQMIGDGDGRAGFYEPIKLALGRYFQEHGSAAEPDIVLTELRRSIAAAPRDKRLHDDAYVANRVADLHGWVKWTRDAQAASEQAHLDLPVAVSAWGGDKVSLERGSGALDAWLMTFFWFNHSDAGDVRQTLAAHSIALEAWRERRRRWAGLQDLHLDAAIFPEQGATDLSAEQFPEPPPVGPAGFERVGLKVTAGVGKTTSVVRELSARIKACGERAVYAVPNHAKCAEIADEFAKHGIVAETWFGFAYPAAEPSCVRADEAKGLIDAGGSLTELCGKCPSHPGRGGTCRYQAQRARRPDVWIVPHAALRYAPRMADHTFDWLVIDEAYSVPIKAMRLPIAELCAVEENGRRRNSPRHEASLARIGEVLRRHPVGPLQRTAFSEFDGTQCAERAASVMVDHTPPSGVGGSIDEVAAANDRVKKRRAFWSLMAAFVEGEQGSSGRLFWNGTDVVMQAPEMIADGWLQSHVLLIDATLDAMVARQWLPGLKVWAQIDVESLAHVRFVTDPPVAFNKIVPGATEAANRRTQENNLRRLFHRLEAEAGVRAAIGQDILAVMPKGSEDWIRAEYEGRLPRNLHVEHFGNLRGINRYETVAKVIAISRAQPHMAELQRITEAMFDRPMDALPTDYLPRRLRLLKMRDGSDRGVPVEMHPVDEAQALLQQVREAEVEQAAHRARPVRRRCEIDLVSIVGIDMTIDETLSFPDWIDEGNVVALALARGVLPETKTDFAKVVSDVCSYREIKNRLAEGTNARRDLDAALAAANEGKTPYIESLIRRFALIRGEDFPLPPWRPFRVRVDGKRKGFRVWIDPAIADARLAAESYLGDLAEFTAEAHGDRTGEIEPSAEPEITAAAEPVFTIYAIGAAMGVSRFRVDRRKSQPDCRGLEPSERERRVLEWMCLHVGAERFREGLAKLRASKEPAVGV